LTLQIIVWSLNGFIKKSNKNYIKAIKDAERILEEYLKSKGL